MQPKQCSESEREIERDKEQDRYVQKAKANQEKLLGFRKLQYGLNWPVSQKKNERKTFKSLINFVLIKKIIAHKKRIR